MSISKFVFIVSMNVKKEYEDLFNEVYDEEHVPHLLNVPGVNKVTRGKGIPFNFSIGGETKSMDSPNQNLWLCMKLIIQKLSIVKNGQLLLKKDDGAHK